MGAVCCKRGCEMILPADGFQTPLPIYSDVEIQTLQDPEYVVDGLIEDRALHGNYGPTGEGKTFVTMVTIRFFFHLAWMLQKSWLFANSVLP